ncbi:hypothetical protein GCM10011331_17170 [Flavimobilis marinus]|uniref:PH domain-containing protein n=1 Tax=Flavimobilis marinus TaxID=285351 RepID=A0A1I2FBF6_9MICO|nr:PH domain-containing protein [Flavimobilis marinus]GHG52394.1 hypothetical protein GCM10011331_17170 [Flavimobilis marinus]SFF02814.1 PH domain-containing protein [Flavimobilis marinus]
MAGDAPTLYTPFRPRMTRVVGAGIGGLLTVSGVVLWLTSPGAPGTGYDALNTAGLVAVLSLGLLLVWRHATVHALVTPEGIRVRNLVHTTVLAWDQIEGVRFGSGQPWVSLDLVDGNELAVMAVQSADGAFATQEARRLATLVGAHGTPRPPAG